MLDILTNIVGTIFTIIGLFCLCLSPWYRDRHSPIFQRTTNEFKVIAVGIFYGGVFMLAGILLLSSTS